MKKTNTIWLLVALLAMSGCAQAACRVNTPLSRPDSRYEVVAGATPTGSEVRDKVTGLVWQRCVLGMAWDGATCTGTPTMLSWPNAFNAALSAATSTAGTGAAAIWRVPNYVELFSLVELACNNPAINTTLFPAAPPFTMWSSSPSASYSNYVLTVTFNSGNDSVTYLNDTNRVRLVRAGQ